MWDYSLSANEMENYAKCEKTEAWETAKIQWKNLTNIWSIIGEKSAVKTEYIERNKMCVPYVKFVCIFDISQIQRKCN